MNSENSNSSDPHRLLLNPPDKIELKGLINILLYQIVAFTIHGKIQKKKKLKFRVPENSDW